MTEPKRLIDLEFDRDVCCDLLPEWKNLDIQISKLSGGITNKLYRIQSEMGDYTVRIYGDQTELFVDRFCEAHTIKEMEKVGVGSRLIKFLPEKGVTIVEFIDDSIVLSSEDFLNESLHEKIVAPIRKIHTSRIQLKRYFNPLLEIMKMSAILKNINDQYSEFDIVGIIQRLIKLSSIINIPESEYVACHNDLLADNFILIREEATHRYGSSMYLIDWEYGGMAPKYYDLADMFQEILVPRDTEKNIIAQYCKSEDLSRVLFYVDLFKPFPDIYWFLWSLIQLNISKIEFDYYNYGKNKFENCIKNMKYLEKEYGVLV